MPNMPENLPNRQEMTDHDLLIRLDERMENIIERVSEVCDNYKIVDKLKGRVLRLEVIVSVIASGGTIAASVTKGLGVW